MSVGVNNEARFNGDVRSCKPLEPFGAFCGACVAKIGWLWFVTRECDGLFYLWFQENTRTLPSWTYAYKTKRAAMREINARRSPRW